MCRCALLRAPITFCDCLCTVKKKSLKPGQRLVPGRVSVPHGQNHGLAADGVGEDFDVVLVDARK